MKNRHELDILSNADEELVEKISSQAKFSEREMNRILSMTEKKYNAKKITATEPY